MMRVVEDGAHVAHLHLQPVAGARSSCVGQQPVGGVATDAVLGTENIERRHGGGRPRQQHHQGGSSRACTGIEHASLTWREELLAGECDRQAESEHDVQDDGAGHGPRGERRARGAPPLPGQTREGDGQRREHEGRDRMAPRPGPFVAEVVAEGNF